MWTKFQSERQEFNWELPVIKAEEIPIHDGKLIETRERTRRFSQNYTEGAQVMPMQTES